MSNHETAWVYIASDEKKKELTRALPPVSARERALTDRNLTGAKLRKAGRN